MLQLDTVLPQVPRPTDRWKSYIITIKTEAEGMGKTVFIPLTDDLLYDHPERILGPVIPFSQQARHVALKPTGAR